MGRRQVLRWLAGRGWLVLSGGQQPGSEIRALALVRVAADGAVAIISPGGSEAAEGALTDIEDLGAPSGYLVDVLAEDDDTIISRLSQAAMIVIESGSRVSDLRSSLMGAAATGLQAAYANGAVILAEGLSAMVFGRWVLLESGKLVAGLDWLNNALVVPAVTSASESDGLRALLNRQPEAVAVGVGLGSALALGPDDEVETWGLGQVSVTLGRHYSH